MQGPAFHNRNMNLTKQHCVPCEGGAKPMTETKPYFNSISKEWQPNTKHKQISKKLTFKNFQPALDFINRVGELAESEGHHPDIHLTGYKHVTLDLSTHAIGGLSVNDFIMAAKIDRLKGDN